MASPQHTRDMLTGLLANDPRAFDEGLHDPCFFFDSCLWTYDPRAERGKMPFVLWPFQRRFVHWAVDHIFSGKDFLGEKSRDMGATWMILGIDLWAWMFLENFHALLGSRKEEYVDKPGDLTTHFERLRFMIRHLPQPIYEKYLYARGFRWKQHSGYMKLLNPGNGNQISGESTNPNFSRQGRFTFIFMDEFAFIEQGLQKEVWTATADTSDCRAAISTPNGLGSFFADLRFSESIDVKTLRWTMHPRKAKGLYYIDEQGVHHGIDPSVLTEDEKVHGVYKGIPLRSPWYDKEDERRKATPGDMAQEVDIDYLTSGHPVFSGEWSKRHKLAITPARWKFEPIVTWSTDGQAAVKWEQREDGCFRVWEGKPRGKSIYCIGVDASEGLADEFNDSDYHAVVVWDVVNRHIVATLRTRTLDPRDVAVVIADLTRRWDAFLTVERNGPGLAVLSVLSGLLTGHHLDTEVFRPRRFQDRAHKMSRDAGFKTTRESKHHLVELIRHWTNPSHCHLRDERLIHEYTIFAHLPGYKMGAPSGQHDDMVMALGQALVAAQTALTMVPSMESYENDVDYLIYLQNKALEGKDVRPELRELVG